MVSKLKSLGKRKSSAADISPGDAFGPLSDDYKLDSTRARFEELASTYRNSHDKHGHALSKLDDAVQGRESLIQLLASMKEGEIPPTCDIVDMVRKLDFDKMREYTTTFQGKKVIDHFENSTAAGIRAFEEINGEENAQEIVRDLNNARIKTKDDRKVLAQKVKKGAKESKEIVSDAGKDFLVLAGGVATSAAFRKAVTDLASLVSLTVRNKQTKYFDTEPLTNRVRDLVLEVRTDRYVQRSLKSLNSLFTTVHGKSAQAAKEAQDKVKGHEATEDLKDARDHARDIFTRLGNGYDLTALFAAISAIGVMYRDNEEFSKLIGDMKDFGSWAMNVEAEKLTSEEFKTRSHELIEKGRSTLTEKDQEQFKTVSEESQNYMNAVKANPVLVDYKDAMAGLAHSVVGHSDMTSEERREHHRALRQDVMANLPVLIQAIRYLPIPRVSGQNNELEFAADNIVLDLQHFVPEHISFDSHTEVYPRAAMLKEDKAKHSRLGFRTEQFFYITITGVHCKARRVAFYVKKKKGIPRVAEKGLADLVMDGRGMDITLRLRKLHESETPRVPLPASEDSKPISAKAAGKKSSLKQPKKSDSARSRPERMFDIADVKVKMHNLSIHVHENKHTISGKLGLALMMPVAKRLISKRLAQSLAEFMVQGDRMLSKYGSSAESMVVGGSRRVFSVAVGAAKQGATKSKEQLGKLKSKDAKEQVKDAKEEVKDAAKAVADKAHDLADTENKLAQQQEYRRDSLVERI